MTHVTCRLTAKNWDQLRNPTLGNRVWASFTFSAYGTLVTDEAGRSVSLASDVTEDDLGVCSRCAKPLSDLLPQMFPCFHAFCASCLASVDLSTLVG